MTEYFNFDLSDFIDIQTKVYLDFEELHKQLIRYQKSVLTVLLNSLLDSFRTFKELLVQKNRQIISMYMNIQSKDT